MEGLLKSMYEKLQEAIRLSELKGDNGFQRAHACLLEVGISFSGLETYMKDLKFSDIDEEVKFYKEDLPLFGAEHFYHNDILFIEGNKPLDPTKATVKYFTVLLKEKELFFKRNQELYSYFRLGRTDHDRVLFLKAKNESSIQSFQFLDLEKAQFSDSSTLFSMFIAYERVTEYLKKGIRDLLDGKKQDSESKKQPYLWTDSKAALIELGYALYSRGSINQGKGDVKSIIRALEETFNVETGNFYRTFQSMRIRKKNRTVFLDSLRESLEKRMDETDLD